jgi:hypothetical protein
VIDQEQGVVARLKEIIRAHLPCPIICRIRRLCVTKPHALISEIQPSHARSLEVFGIPMSWSEMI